MDEQRNGFGSLILSFLAGSIFGALVAYVTAPRSGEETREQIMGQSAAIQDSAEHTASEAMKSMRGTAQDINKMAEEFRSQSQIALDESKEQWLQAANEIKKTALEAIEETRAAASEAIENSKKATV
jgi:gas vesicle protein